jgi:hypothetical protein
LSRCLFAKQVPFSPQFLAKVASHMTFNRQSDALDRILSKYNFLFSVGCFPVFLPLFLACCATKNRPTALLADKFVALLMLKCLYFLMSLVSSGVNWLGNWRQYHIEALDNALTSLPPFNQCVFMTCSAPIYVSLF